MIVKDISATSEVCMPPQGPLTLPHSHIYSSAFAQQKLFQHIHAFTFMQPHSRQTYAAAFTPDLCSSIDTAALKLQRPLWSTQHLPCSTHTAAFFRRSHATAFMLQRSHCSIFAATFSLHRAASMYDLIFFLQQKATFLQVELAISKSQSTAGFRV